MKNKLSLSDMQSKVVDRFSKIGSKNSKRYIALPACPGSGKTETVIRALENFFSAVSLKKDTQRTIDRETSIFFKGYESPKIKEEFSLEELTNHNQKSKILILAFNKNAIDEIVKRADKIDINTITTDVTDDGISYQTEKGTKMSLLVEASTYHSLLLKSAKPIIEALGYVPDYSKSTFFKKDIDFISQKNGLRLTKKEVDLYHTFIDGYHNSPLSYRDFCKKFRDENASSNFDIEMAKKIQFIINNLYAEMSKKNITMPHCLYYKLVHQRASENPEFLKSIFRDSTGNEIDYILVDEAQDSDAIIYDLIKRSEKKAVFVGDTFQNIYGFRGTYNIFEDLTKNEQNATDFFELSESFRYGKSIANLTSSLPRILGHTSTSILNTTGVQDDDYVYTKPINMEMVAKLSKNIIIENLNKKLPKKETMNQVAIICRSNKKALEIYSELKKDNIIAPNVKIESGLKSRAKDFVSKGLLAIEDEALREQINYILGEGNFSFESMLRNDEVCNLLANTEHAYILKFKDENLKNAMLQKSSGYETVTIITVHGSKGLEYPNVIIADDYIKDSEDMMSVPVFDYGSEVEYGFGYEQENKAPGTSSVPVEANIDTGLTNDEINIIYTAMTRAKGSLYIMPSKLYNFIEPQIIEASKYNSPSLERANNRLLTTDFVLNEDTDKKQKAEQVNDITNNAHFANSLFAMS